MEGKEMIPKFRIFIKTNTKTVDGLSCNKDMMYEEISNIDFYNQEVTVWGCGIEGCEMCDDTFRLEDVILMQSTGLTDVNGKEIFEGDVVIARWWNIHGDHERVMLVEWNENELGWNLINKSSTNMNYEIIGNIHEHSHLLDNGGQ